MTTTYKPLSPEELSAPATVGFVLETVSNDLTECAHSQSIERQKLWDATLENSKSIQAVTSKIDRINGALALMVVLIGILAPLSYFALRGVIVEELDKRFPVMLKQYHVSKDTQSTPDQSSVNNNIPVRPWSVVSSAQASNK